MSTNEKSLYYLEELPDYKVASEDCDVRGWYVKDKDGQNIGKVDGLLVNKVAERAVYLDVEVDKELIAEGRKPGLASAGEGTYEFLHKDGDDHIIIPVGLITLNEENQTVCADGIDYNTFAKAGRFQKGQPILREYEITLMRHYLQPSAIDYPSDINDNFYDGKEFNNALGRPKMY